MVGALRHGSGGITPTDQSQAAHKTHTQRSKSATVGQPTPPSSSPRPESVLPTAQATDASDALTGQAAKGQRVAEEESARFAATCSASANDAAPALLLEEAPAPGVVPDARAGASPLAKQPTCGAQAVPPTEAASGSVTQVQKNSSEAPARGLAQQPLVNSGRVANGEQIVGSAHLTP